MLFTESFISVVVAAPEAIAVIDGATKISYRQLHKRACNLARKISSTTQEMLIGVLIERSADYIVSILAVHLLGRTAVPLNTDYPIERLRQMIKALNLELCLVNQNYDNEFKLKLQNDTHTLNIDVQGEERYDTCISVTPKDEQAAYIVFTSGSTGQPKPVMMPYRSLSALIEWMGKESQPRGNTLLYATLGFDVSFQEIYSTLCHGHCILTVTETQKKDLHTLIGLLSSHQVTRLFLPTSMLIPLVSFDLYDPKPMSKLKEIIVAGEQLKVTPAVRRWFNSHLKCRLINHYGPSETHVVMVHQLNDEPESWPDLPPIGRPTPASAAYLLDDNLQTVEIGKMGQLYIAGDALALGYYDMPKLTADKFVEHPQTSERMYSTGDMCILNDEGLYEYRGRIDRQHKVRGYRVDLKEIEVVVTSSGLVEDCIMVARKFGPTTSLILYFTSQPGDQDITMLIYSHLAARVPDYMLPSFYAKVATMPLTRNGKIDIEKLPPVWRTRSQELPAYVAPQDELELKICTLAASCFGLDIIGACDSFMDAGANSMTLISLIAELRHVLDHDFRQTDIFEYPTPRHLCTAYRYSRDALEPIASEFSANKIMQRSATIHRSQLRKRG